MMTDPIADMITRIRNAGIAKHAETACPSSRMKSASISDPAIFFPETYRYVPRTTEIVGSSSVVFCPQS